MRCFFSFFSAGRASAEADLHAQLFFSLFFFPRRPEATFSRPSFFPSLLFLFFTRRLYVEARQALFSILAGRFFFPEGSFFFPNPL